MEIQATDLLAQSLGEVVGRKTDRKKQERSCALVVAFNNFTYHQEFMAVFNAELGEFLVLDDCLVKFYSSQQIARDRANFIGRVISRYGNAILKMPFDQDWLDTYLEIGRFGVNCEMVDHHLESAKKLGEYRIKRAKDRAERDAYQRAVDQAADKCLTMDIGRIVSDFTKFIVDNWVGWPDEQTVRKTFAQMAVSIQADMEGVHYLPRHPAQLIWYALGLKDEHCQRQRGVAEKKISSNYMLRRDMEDKYLVKKSVWEKCYKSIRPSLQRNLPKLNRIGFPELLEDEEASLPDSIPFAGISFKHNWELCMDSRLSAESMLYNKSQGRNVLTVLAQAFAAYYLGIVEIRQEQKLERLLRDFSRGMDKESFVDNIPGLLKESLDNIPDKDQGRKL